MTIDMILGNDTNGNPVVCDLTQIAPVLVNIDDSTGEMCGLELCVLDAVTKKYSPDECKIVLIGTDFYSMSAYAEIPHLMRPVTETMADAVRAIKELSAEVDLRRKAQDSAPPIVAIIGDLARIIDSDKTMASEIQNLAMWGRDAGIYIVAADCKAVKKTLKPIPENLDSDQQLDFIERHHMKSLSNLIIANFATRITFRTATRAESVKYIGGAGAEKLSHNEMLFKYAAKIPIHIKMPTMTF